ncbi:integrase, catalytic region, zinc finger, CCHC-type containing protein [Tanacetum coccineum]|uniref:Integrase, catalytic region, zinc finger, CCHC-type containing protein n=1 Tax=Tanacetum coccineum TaxID=301880 RepID=A0ABQ5I504_9ASTR
MRIEQYFLMTNYALWEVIVNRDSPPPKRTIDGVDQTYPPTTIEEKLARKNELKAREYIPSYVFAAAAVPSTLRICMFKLDLEPLAPRLLQNREAHIDYLKYTQEQADILQGIVEQAKAKQPLDKELDFACNKKNDRISRTPSRNMKNKVEAQPRKVNKKNSVVEPIRDVDDKNLLLNVNSEPICATCKKSMFNGVHDMCLLNFVENVNSRAKFAKKHKKQNIWKPTGHIFTEVGLKWKPIGRTFTIVGSSKKAKIIESKNANHSKPNHTWGSNVTNIPSSSSLVMTGTVRFGNDHIARIIGYGDYQLGNVTISRVYYAGGLGHNLFSVGQFYDADLEVVFWKNTCFIRNLEDNGTEFVNQTLQEFYENVGISHQTSVARTQQNNVVKRQNQTLVEAARTMLIFSKALLFLWDKVINTACYTQNRSLIRLRYNKTPYELMQDKKPDLSFFHVFGALCYPTNDNDDLSKLDAKAYIAMASEQFSSGPGLHSMTPATSIQKAVSLRAVVLVESPVSTSIDQDAPSLSIPSTQEQKHSPNISQGFEESPKTLSFRDDPLHKSLHKDSTS